MGVLVRLDACMGVLVRLEHAWVYWLGWTSMGVLVRHGCIG